MRKLSVLLAAAIAIGLANESARAGLVTSLLSADNTQNDQIQDRSLGYLIDVDGNGSPNSNDIGWGLIRVDKIGNTDVNNHVWMVYAGKLTSDSSPYTHTFVPDGDAYSLKNILGSVGSSINYGVGGPFAALLETPSSITFDGLDFDGSSNSKKPSDLKTAIQSQFASAQLIATVGLKDTQDYYRLEGASSTLNQVGELSILESFVGLVTDWKSLLDPYPLDGQVWTNNEAAIKPGSVEAISYHTDDGSYFKTADNGTYHVNYVPEPGSMIGLASLALAGAGLGFARRRKAQA